MTSGIWRAISARACARCVAAAVVKPSRATSTARPSTKSASSSTIRAWWVSFGPERDVADDLDVVRAAGEGLTVPAEGGPVELGAVGALKENDLPRGQTPAMPPNGARGLPVTLRDAASRGGADFEALDWFKGAFGRSTSCPGRDAPALPFVDSFQRCAPECPQSRPQAWHGRCSSFLQSVRCMRALEVCLDTPCR